MNLDSGIDLTELRVDGGASKNNFLMQFQADILGVPVDRPELVETTAAGSAFLAGLAVGVWSSPEDLNRARDRDCIFQPNMAHDQRESLYAGWRQAVARVRSRTGD
jgi:glycerol kinase